MLHERLLFLQKDMDIKNPKNITEAIFFPNQFSNFTRLLNCETYADLIHIFNCFILLSAIYNMCTDSHVNNCFYYKHIYWPLNVVLFCKRFQMLQLKSPFKTLYI